MEDDPFKQYAKDLTLRNPFAAAGTVDQLRQQLGLGALQTDHLKAMFGPTSEVQRIAGGFSHHPEMLKAAFSNDSISSITKQFQDSMRLLDGNLSDTMKQLMSNRASIDATLLSFKTHASDIADQFRLMNQTDLTRWAGLKSEMIAPAWADRPEFKIQTDFMRSFEMPIVKINDSMASFRALSELQVLGQAVRGVAPYDNTLTLGLRADLGDWRDGSIDVTPFIDKPQARIQAYRDRGFDSELTDFPEQAFEATLTITEISLGAIADYLQVPPALVIPKSNELGFQWLFVFEREIRKFIVRSLQGIADPWESRLPDGMYEEWLAKKQRALQAGRSNEDAIHYADFTDYSKIILKRANWREVFKDIFKRQELVIEGFNRLEPLRVVAAHTHPLTTEEFLILHLEIRRLLRAMGFLL